MYSTVTVFYAKEIVQENCDTATCVTKNSSCENDDDDDDDVHEWMEKGEQQELTELGWQ
jgi:hypothetical protein